MKFTDKILLSSFSRSWPLFIQWISDTVIYSFRINRIETTRCILNSKKNKSKPIRFPIVWLIFFFLRISILRKPATWNHLPSWLCIVRLKQHKNLFCVCLPSYQPWMKYFFFFWNNASGFHSSIRCCKNYPTGHRDSSH